ncbi:MAG: hypothetical protein P8Y53_20090 [Pseudolabrys sp.]
MMLRAHQEFFALGGQMDAARGAAEQRRAEKLFELAQLCGERRL